MTTQPAPAHDPVHHPKHYNSHPSGRQCIELTRELGFNDGNAAKYLWRRHDKANALEDMRKALWYVHDEIARLEAFDALDDWADAEPEGHVREAMLLVGRAGVADLKQAAWHIAQEIAQMEKAEAERAKPFVTIDEAAGYARTYAPETPLPVTHYIGVDLKPGTDSEKVARALKEALRAHGQ